MPNEVESAAGKESEFIKKDILLLVFNKLNIIMTLFCVIFLELLKNHCTWRYIFGKNIIVKRLLV